MTTIAVNKTLGIDLNPAIYTSPVVIRAGVTVSNTNSPTAVSWYFGATTFFVIDNNGTITGSGTGVYLAPGGSVTNARTARIKGGNGGVIISGGAGTVVNDGSIAGSSGFGVDLLSGGSVTNGAAAYIAGVIGVYLSGGTLTNAGSISGSSAGVIISGGAGTVVNDGSIAGSSGFGVDLLSGGSVTNGASAHIAGVIGVSLYGGTLTNAGSIIGSGGTAVAFGGTGSDLLVLDAGFGFSGVVSGGRSSSNSLELASGSSTGTVTGLGTQFTRFGTIAFDAGAQWFASGIQRGLAGPISGFAVGDTIELTGDTAVGSSFVTGVLTLDLAGGGSATLDLPGTFTSASDFVVTNVAASADVTVVACFLAGTRILTAGGEVLVEELREHDLVLAQGRMAPIIWIGRRHIDCRRHAHAADILPVRVRAGAFGDGLPVRDLLLSPDHAVFVGGVLIPIRYLINGSTIIQEQVDEVTYYHVELAAHDVILAEGLPCESYLDTGNRAAFANGGAETLAQRG